MRNKNSRGPRPGPANDRNWENLAPGDFVLVYQSGEYTFHSRVISKHRNKAFAKALCGVDEENQTWEQMYFLEHPVPVRVQATELVGN